MFICFWDRWWKFSSAVDEITSTTVKVGCVIRLTPLKVMRDFLPGNKIITKDRQNVNFSGIQLRVEKIWFRGEIRSGVAFCHKNILTLIRHCSVPPFIEWAMIFCSYTSTSVFISPPVLCTSMLKLFSTNYCSHFCYNTKSHNASWKSSILLIRQFRRQL